VTTPDPLAASALMKATLTNYRDETESQRRIPAKVVSALIDARLNRLVLTEDVGGCELPPVELMEVLATLAGAEASVSWVVWNNALPCWMSRFLTQAARSELFSDPTWFYANATRPSGKATRTKDGYRVSGHWTLVSGCELAEWVMLTCIVDIDGEVQFLQPGVPETRLVFVHRTELEIIDTWHVGGLRGTGSHDVVVKDSEVLAHRTFSPLTPVELDTPIARVPIISTMAGGMAAQLLGIAQSAIDTVIELGRTKVTADPAPNMRDRVPTQIAIASHPAAINGARLNLYQAVDSAWGKACAGEPASYDDIAKIWCAAVHACEIARQAIDSMYFIAGSSAIYQSSPLERAHRDARVMLQHVSSQPIWLEEAGRHTFGLEPINPLYVL
jgi:alkylation response protein AidB-like acyl-CoA dehydrogenase